MASLMYRLPLSHERSPSLSRQDSRRSAALEIAREDILADYTGAHFVVQLSTWLNDNVLLAILAQFV